MRIHEQQIICVHVCKMGRCSTCVCLILRECFHTAFCLRATLKAHVPALVYIHECVFMLAEGEHAYASVCVCPP